MYSRFLCTSLLFISLALGGCTESEPEGEGGSTAPTAEVQSAEPANNAVVDGSAPESGVDYHSFANTDDYRIEHLDLDLTVDFSRKVLEGEARLRIERLTEKNPPLVLDTRDLDIESVAAGQDQQLEPVAFSLGEKDDHLGTPLTIELPDDATTVAIRYRTSPGASGVQWLEPEQTAGKKHPFLFTQAQAIHARSFVPLQDSPKVRMTYEATIAESTARGDERGQRSAG